MGEKNMFKKSSKLFDREGFYIVLFVCLCIVAVTAVYITKYNSGTTKKVSKVADKNHSIPARTTDPVLTQDKAKVVATSKQPVKSTKDVAMQMAKSKKNAESKTSRLKAKENFKLAYPVKGEITKKFDIKELQESKAIGQWETHEGIDIACPPGSEVKAASNGKVVEIITKDEKLSEGEKNGYGASIVIDHENGYRTVYSNLAVESMKLKKGDNVKQGQVIAAVGDTSLREAVSIEGSHLHFALLKKSGKDYVSVDPQEFLK